MKKSPPRLAAFAAALLLVPSGPLPTDALGRGGQGQQQNQNRGGGGGGGGGGGNSNRGQASTPSMGGSSMGTRSGGGAPRVVAPRPVPSRPTVSRGSSSPRPVAKSPSVSQRSSVPNRSGGSSNQASRSNNPSQGNRSVSAPRPPQRPTVSKPSPSVVSRGYSPPSSVSPKPAQRPSAKPSAKPSPSVASRGSVTTPAPKPSSQVARKPDGGGNGGGNGGNDRKDRNDRAPLPAAAQGGNGRATNSPVASVDPAGPRGGAGGSNASSPRPDPSGPNAGKNTRVSSGPNLVQANRGGAENGGGGKGGSQAGGGQGGNQQNNNNNKASRPSRITTLASRGGIYHNPRAGVYGAIAGEGSAEGGRGGSGGGGAASYEGGGSAGGGGYGVWRHASYAPYRTSYVSPTFCHSVNYAYLPEVWGYRPWWGASYNYSWHNGCWDYGWNHDWTSRYAYYSRPALYYPPGYGSYDLTPSTFVPWGLASWTLGRLAYDTGYYSYYNPYTAPPVTTSTTIIRYAEPITVVASNAEPATEELAETAAEKSSAAMDRAREAFRVGDYVSASKAIDEGISHTPGDPVLHEFRSLVLFALGRYGDAAGVLHSVLASGPGWDWETMIGFYDKTDRYTEQFRKLEDYVVAHPDAPEPHFLLGYHYMVGENLTEAYAMFDRASTLQPSDTVSRQLKSLLADSAPETAPEPAIGNEPAPAAVEPAKAPVAEESLYGIWMTKSAEDKAITLSLTAIGTFTWNYEGATGDVLSGEWSIDEDGLLVLAATDVQMVGDITLNEDGSLHFLLAGSPEGDPGLTFRKE